MPSSFVLWFAQLALAAPVPQPAISLPEAIVLALRTADSRSLKAFYIPRDYETYVERTISSFGPSSGQPRPKPVTKEEYARLVETWPDFAARQTDRDIARTRSFGSAIGFAWSEVRLLGVRIQALDGEGFQYHPKANAQHPGPLALVLSDGKKELTVFVAIEPTKRGPSLSGNWVSTDLTAKERETFSKWRLDMTGGAVIPLLAKRRLSRDYFELIMSSRGFSKGGHPAMTVRLPKMFSASERNKIELVLDFSERFDDGHPLKSVLVETRPGSFSFEGVYPLDLSFLSDKPKIFDIPITLKLNREDGREIAKKATWRAQYQESVPVEFQSLPAQPGRFRCPHVSIIQFGNDLTGQVDITFIDGIARKISPTRPRPERK